MAPYNPNAVLWNVTATIFVQLVLGLVFTRVAWITKTALDAEVVGKALSTPSTGSVATSSEGGSPDQRKSVRAASRAELKERALRMSQSPKPREGTSANSSHSDVEMQEAAPPTALVVVDMPLTETDVVVV